MEPHEHNEKNNQTHHHIDATELKQYFQHNIRHLEEHIKSFKKLQNKIEDTHALQSLEAAIDHLQKGIDELKHFLQHI